QKSKPLRFRLVWADRAVAFCPKMTPAPRARAIVHLGGLLLGVAGVLGAEGRASAGTSDIVTRVTCPALPVDVRAEFEARAQVDLTLRSAGGGELDVVCDRLAARVTWRPKAG